MTDQPGDRSPAPPGRIAGGDSRPRRVTLVLAALAARAALLLVAKVRIRELAVPPVRGRGAIIAFNHRSMADILVCAIALHRWGVYPRTFARASFFALPVVGRLIRFLGAIPAGAGTDGAAALAAGCDVLRGDGVIAIAPEGRIVPPAERPDGLGRLKGGVGVMSSRLGTPVLLSAITGTDRAWPPGRRTPILHLPWHRPTVTLSAEWLEVPAGTPHEDVTARVAHGLRALLDAGEPAPIRP